MRLIFFKEMFKLLCHFHKLNETFTKIYGFLDNCIWFGLPKSSLILGEYLSSAVNVLTKISSISDLLKRDVFQLNSS